MAKTSLLKKRTERILQGKGGPSQERHWHWYNEVGGFFKTELLHIHLDRRGLTVLIDSCKLHNNKLYCACLSHNSICYNQMYVCIEYLWTLNRLPLPKVTWGHSCASRVHALELKKALWLFCSVSVSSPGQHRGILGWGLEISLNHFWLGHPF